MLNQLVRYAAVVPLIAEVDGATLLDVGSGSRSVAPRLSERWRVTAVDRSFDDYGTARGPVDSGAERVLGDATSLPFADRAFDVVLCLDMLEHVPAGVRGRVLAELARVTRRRAVVACPAGQAAHDADRALAGFYDRAGLPRPGWLDEHLEAAFPEPQAVGAALAPFGRVRLRRNESVRTHAALMRAEAGRRTGPALELLSRALAAAGRESAPLGAPARAAVRVLRGFDLAPAYRVVAILDRT